MNEGQMAATTESGPAIEAVEIIGQAGDVTVEVVTMEAEANETPSTPETGPVLIPATPSDLEAISHALATQEFQQLDITTFEMPQPAARPDELPSKSFTIVAPPTSSASPALSNYYAQGRPSPKAVAGLAYDLEIAAQRKPQ